MKWTEYPNDDDRKARRNGVPREGQIVSDAPDPGGKCALTPERKFALVITRVGHSWSIADHSGKTS